MTRLSRRKLLQAMCAGGAALSPLLGRVHAAEGEQVMGTGKGIHPGRVVWGYNPATTPWDGEDGQWWEPRNLDEEEVKKTLHRSLARLTGEDSREAAWDALFRHFNSASGRREGGYEKGEKIAIKVNLNTSNEHKWDNRLDVSPQLLHGVLSDLIDAAGVPESAVTVYDASRIVGAPVWDRCHGDYPGVTFADMKGGQGRKKAEADRGAALHFADPEVPDSGATYLPQCVTDADYMINMALLKGHTLAGVTLNAKNHFGSVWREGESHRQGWAPQHMHPFILAHGDDAREMGTYNPLVELMGHPHLGGKTMLHLVEGFYAARHQSLGPARWTIPPFDGDWTSSLLVSQDPVAIESVAVDMCVAEPNMQEFARGTLDNYLHEASRAGSPPSGVNYRPDGETALTGSLGAHEHWNSVEEKQYSRNLGRNRGIELVRV